MPVPVPKVHRSAFAGACFTGVSDVLGGAGVHKEALAGHNRMSTDQDLPHDWIMILAIDLATFCGTFSTIGPQLGPLTSVEKI